MVLPGGCKEKQRLGERTACPAVSGRVGVLSGTLPSWIRAWWTRWSGFKREAQSRSRDGVPVQHAPGISSIGSRDSGLGYSVGPLGRALSSSSEKQHEVENKSGATTFLD